ncbi:hypothetical protein DES37_108239 [Mangrovibacter plantisponsor]|uniref:Uncharacterized protein n=1 Tax=Mangrovibacter plantisponsor TaxID=451513 RepID=A0A317PXB1_9ENTR|nr:hypothetical protein DES37_108239 [Mangrovibacter plantisponsor]
MLVAHIIYWKEKTMWQTWTIIGLLAICVIYNWVENKYHKRNHATGDKNKDVSVSQYRANNPEKVNKQR